jgi:hypothetical protein
LFRKKIKKEVHPFHPFKVKEVHGEPPDRKLLLARPADAGLLQWPIARTPITALASSPQDPIEAPSKKAQDNTPRQALLVPLILSAIFA